MTTERYNQLFDDKDGTFKLTEEEVTEGWHFCTEWDGLLVGPEMGELMCCICWPKDHPVYKTTPPDPNEYDPEFFDRLDDPTTTLNQQNPIPPNQDQK